eukprot:883720-Alexandrium_andersonii.AAC.1
MLRARAERAPALGGRKERRGPGGSAEPEERGKKKAPANTRARRAPEGARSTEPGGGGPGRARGNCLHWPKGEARGTSPSLPGPRGPRPEKRLPKGRRACLARAMAGELRTRPQERTGQHGREHGGSAEEGSGAARR